MKQRIVITRPLHQSKALSQGIQAAGGEVCLFPTLEIIPNELTRKDKGVIQQLEKFDIIIFISPNAVEHGLNLMGALPVKTLLATIGQGSAKILISKLGRKPDIVPKESFNSEGLLSTKALQNVSNKRILIVRGNSGRELLKDVLLQRGATVEYLPAYQRIKPATNPAELEQYLQNKQIAVIVITSVESLKNLAEMTPQIVRENLHEVPLLVINSRIEVQAREMEFHNKIFIAKQASDEGIIDTLKQNKLLKIMHS